MIRKSCLFVVLLCLLGSTALAGIIAEVSCRTEGGSYMDANRHDSRKLSVRASSNGNKSWIRFNLGGLDISNLASATLTVFLAEAKAGDQNFDVSVVNDDCLDNINWAEREITWNNAPGNKTDDLGLLDPTKTTLLTTVAFTDGAAGLTFDVDVLAALQSDTDGIVQFVLHNSPNLLQIATHDHADHPDWAPVINVIEIPEPLTFALLGLGGLVALRRKVR